MFNLKHVLIFTLINELRLKNFKNIILSTFIIFFAFSYLFIINSDSDLELIYLIAGITLSILYILFYYLVQKNNFGKTIIWLSITISILIKFYMTSIPTIGSDDVYRYIFDGKLQANGINPYLYAPDDKEIDHLISKEFDEKLQFKDLKTIYPPFSQWLFYLSYLLAGESLFGIKLLLLLFDITALLFILLIIKHFNINEKYILIYAFHPLIIFQFFIDAHLDLFGITLLSVFIYFYLKEQKVISFIFLGFCILVKFFPVIIIPIVFFREKGKNKLYSIIIPLLIVILGFSFYIFDANPFESLGIFAKHWLFNGSLFTLFNSFVDHNQISRIILLFIYAVLYILTYKRISEFTNQLSLIFLLFFLLSPVVHPWYLGWLVIFSVINNDFLKTNLVFTLTVSLTYITIYYYEITGIWNQSPIILLIEYIPVYSLLIYEYLSNTRSRSSL